VWRAWQRLSRDRPRIGGGMGPSIPGFVPWPTVMEWADRHRLSDDEATFIDVVLTALADFELKWTIERLKLENKK
jgi:hypothetical protein